jgi:hypothetical protein
MTELLDMARSILGNELSDEQVAAIEQFRPSADTAKPWKVGYILLGDAPEIVTHGPAVATRAQCVELALLMRRVVPSPHSLGCVHLPSGEVHDPEVPGRYVKAIPAGDECQNGGIEVFV